MQVLYNEFASGVFGTPTQMDVSSLLSKDDFGSISFPEANQLLFFTVFGASSFPTISGIPNNVIIHGNLIHYADSATIMTDNLELSQECIVQSPRNYSWLGGSRRVEVIDHVASGTLNINQSSALNINSSASDIIKLDLPSSAPLGVKYTFVKTSANDYLVGLEDSNNFIRSSGIQTTEIILNSIGSKLEVIKGSTNVWETLIESDIDISSAFELLPNEISNLAAWYDASDSGTITLDGSNNVSQWDDKSINGYHITQSTSSDRPAVISGSFNGLDAILFDDANTEYLERVNFISSSPFTTFVVATTDNLSSNHTALTLATDTSLTTHFYADLALVPASPFVVHTVRAGGSSQDALMSLNPVLNQQFLYMGQEISSTSRRCTFNNANEGTQAGSATTPTSLDRMSIGRFDRSSPGNYWSGSILEVVIYSGIPLPSEELLLSNYFQNKWDILF